MTGRAGPARRARERLAEGVGLTELAELEGQVSRLEEAVAENAFLAEALQRYVARIEADLVPPLERSVAEASDRPRDV